MSIGDVKNQVQQGMEYSNEASGMLEGVRSKIEEAMNAVSAATQETSNPLPGEQISMYQTAFEQLEEAARTLQEGNTRGEEFNSSI
ncbi:hypothetical protein [Haloglycomyces albus]|uniref:hypothetical protein n=1 Tax=Haloglycomyces albus TaxID=526067 RepID=UPI00046D7441|nr:hypothetical protein [Haloglycomyces albus]